MLWEDILTELFDRPGEKGALYLYAYTVILFDQEQEKYGILK